MRTEILKYFGMVVVLIIMVNLTSCEVSIESWYDDDDTAKYITEPLGNYAAGPGRKLGYKTVNTTHND